MKKEEDLIEAEVQKRMAALMADQQKQFAAMMEKAVKHSVSELDHTNIKLQKEQKRVEKEFDKAKALITKAEREGEKMAQEAFDRHSRQYREEAQISLLRDLARWHIEVGKTTRDIAVWLDVPQKFVEDIRRIVKSVAKYRSPERKALEGNPKISLSNQGRGGMVHFESRETEFDLWWEFGYMAFVIVEVPTPEEWLLRTKLPLARREEILQFIGEEIVLKEASADGYFIVGENVLTIYKKSHEQGSDKAHNLFEKL